MARVDEYVLNTSSDPRYDNGKQHYTYSDLIVEEFRRTLRETLRSRKEKKKLEEAHEVGDNHFYTCHYKEEAIAVVASGNASQDIYRGGIVPKLVIGTRGKITIWHNGILNYTLLVDTFPNQIRATQALASFSRAATEWESKGFRNVLLRYQSSVENSRVIIKYNSTQLGKFRATSYYPNDSEYYYNEITVYPNFYDDGTGTIRTEGQWDSTMEHEIGHILGLRHEFALTGECCKQAVMLGPANPLSIMSYSFSRSIQSTDITSINSLYTLYPPTQIGTFPIVRIDTR